MIRLAAIGILAAYILTGCASAPVRNVDGYIGPPRDEHGELIQPPVY